MTSLAWSNHSWDTCWKHSQAGLNQDTASQLLLRTKLVMDTAGLPFFIVFGTCLGAIRESRFIPHDTDVDIAILEDHQQAFVGLLNDLKFKLAGLGLIRINALLASLEFDKHYLDVYFFQRTYTCGGFTLTDRQVSTPDNVAFIGQTFLAPGDVKDYLKSKYGDDWQTPIIDKHATT